MKNKIKLAYCSLKILLPVMIVSLTVYSLGISWLSLTQAWFTSQVRAVSNLVETGYWTPATPVQCGWNIPTGENNPNDYPVMIECGGITNGGDPTAPRAAFVWQQVNGNNIYYQREYTYPNGSVGYAISLDNYTPFSAFGPSEGIDGVWTNRVRAFEDVNNNGAYDEGVDVASEWSLPCQITLDTAAPTAQYHNIPRTEALIVDKPASGGPVHFNVLGSIIDSSAVTYQVQLYEKLTAGVNDAFDPLIDQEIVAQRSLVKTVDSPIGQELLLHNIDIYDLSGFHWVVTTATDLVGNQSVLAEKIEITQTSATIITITNSPTRAVKQTLSNPSFEQTFNSWQTTGAVEILSSANHSLPQDGELFAKLEYNQSISQLIDNTGDGVRSVGFWYQLLTDSNQETTAPAMTVFANGQELLNLAPTTNSQPSWFADDNWQYASVYLAEIEAETIDLEFKVVAENATVLLDNFSGETAVINPEAVITIHSQKPEFAPQVAYQYRYRNNLVTAQGDSGLQLTLAHQPDDGLLEFWSIDEQGNAQDRKQIQVWIDYTAPTAISDLQVFKQKDGNYQLAFSAPMDNFFASVREYEVRYSSEPITVTADWDNLPTAEFIFDGKQTSNSPAPMVAGVSEEVVVTTIMSDLEQLYFAVKSLDQAGNLSAISNVAMLEAEPVLDPVATLVSLEPGYLQLQLEFADDYSLAEYELSYQFIFQENEDEPGFELTAGVVGSLTINQGEGKSEMIYLGTCSENGTCTPHLGVEPKSIQVTVMLSSDDGEQLELVTAFEGELHQQLE